MKTVCGILILLLCTSAVRSDFMGQKKYISSGKCQGKAQMIIRYPLNVCLKRATTGSQYITFADKKFTFSTYYATTDCTGTASRTTTSDSNKCNEDTYVSYELVVYTDAEVAKAKAEGVSKISYSASNKCVSPSDIYPVEYIYDASWKDTCIATTSATSSMWTWTTKAFYNKIYSTTNDCTGTATKIFEYKLNECINKSSTSSIIYAKQDAKQVVANSASPPSSAFNAIMFVFVVAITLVQ